MYNEKIIFWTGRCLLIAVWVVGCYAWETAPLQPVCASKPHVPKKVSFEWKQTVTDVFFSKKNLSIQSDVFFDAESNDCNQSSLAPNGDQKK